MPLPDISQFAALGSDEWRGLGLRLAEIGLTSEFLRPAVEVGGNLPPNLRLPVQRWHLRRMDGPAAAAARLFMFEDRVAEGEAREALGEALLGKLREAGLITAQEGCVSSPFHLSIADRLYVFCDDLAHGGDAAMGASETTVELCRAAYPAGHADRALEVGCGAGTVALVLAQRCGRVLATDLNGRALDIARVNAALNGIENVEFRQGDAFAPAGHDTFDLVVSQPPFVSRPEGARDASYLYGGTRGDELPLRLLRSVCAHLAPAGRAVLLVQWPDTGGEPVEESVRRAISCDDARVLLLRYAPTDLDYQCAMYSSAEAAAGGEPFARRFAIWRDHLGALGVRQLQSTLIAIQRDPNVRAWTAAVDVPPECSDAVTSARIDSLIAAHNLANSEDGELLEATLRVPRGVVFAKEYTVDEPRVSSIIARLPEENLGQSLELSEASLLLISLASEAETVSAAIEKFASRRSIGIPQAAEQMLPAIREALRLGVLRPSSHRQTRPSPSSGSN